MRLLTVSSVFVFVQTTYVWFHLFFFFSLFLLPSIWVEWNFVIFKLNRHFIMFKTGHTSYAWRHGLPWPLCALKIHSLFYCPTGRFFPHPVAFLYIFCKNILRDRQFQLGKLKGQEKLSVEPKVTVLIEDRSPTVRLHLYVHQISYAASWFFEFTFFFCLLLHLEISRCDIPQGHIP